MKRSFKSISLISLILFSLSTFAQSPRAVVGDVRGNVFLLKNGNMTNLRMGDHLYEFDEVFTEVGSGVTLHDYHDNEFHLSGSSNVRIMNKLVELKSGYMWVQVTEPRNEDFLIQTINASLSYNSGEFVISFDQDSNKTQVMSLKGTHQFVNIQNRYYNQEVQSGYFSFIADDYENGNPRVATDIGSQTYRSVLALFSGVKPLDAGQERKSRVAHSLNRPKLDAPPVVSRKIASVPTSEQGDVIVIKKHKMSPKRASRLKSIHQDKMRILSSQAKPVKKNFKISYGKKSDVKVNVYRAKSVRKPASRQVSETLEPVKVRKPASIMELNPQVKVRKSPFEASLLKEYKKQMRHSKEINSLINELKSIDNDYNESY